jgi:hypothetical protein
MSALPPKADIKRKEQNVRFVPQADIWISETHRTLVKANEFICAIKTV